MGVVVEGGQRSCTNGGRGNVESQDPAGTEKIGILNEEYLSFKKIQVPEKHLKQC